MRASARLAAPLLLAVSLAVIGCTPSYRADQMAAAIKEIAETEHHFQVSVRTIGHTIAVHLNHKGVLLQEGNQVSLDPAANEILGNMIETIHRVVLSSDAKIDFYLILVSDPSVPGAYLTIVRSLEDVRRANANVLPPTEFILCTIFELKFVGVTMSTIDQLVLNDIKIEQFLSWQLAKRIQARLVEELELHGVPVDVGQCVGEYKDKEFTFTLNVTAKPEAEFDDETVQQIFTDATTVIAQVLSGYQFRDFNQIRLVHPATGRTLLLPKTRLELFR